MNMNVVLNITHPAHFIELIMIVGVAWSYSYSKGYKQYLEQLNTD